MRIIRLKRDGTADPFRNTKFLGANGDRKILIFSVLQLTTSRIGNLTRLINTLTICDVMIINTQYQT